MTWIKICGTTNLDDARAAVDAGADAVGFLFAPSPRRIAPEQARDIIAALPRHPEKVGVFANESPERICEIVEQAGLTAVQLHGDEPPDFPAALARVPGRISRARFRLFKALSVAPGFESELRAFAESGVDALVLDSVRHAEGPRGGTGQAFDWNRAQDFMPAIARHVRIIVAGGLDPENVAEAVRLLRPWGVDVCTGVEREPGKKDHDKLRAFVAAVRSVK
jgi:phosphoribosylanthranilate isomerase